MANGNQKDQETPLPNPGAGRMPGGGAIVGTGRPAPRPPVGLGDITDPKIAAAKAFNVGFKALGQAFASQMGQPEVAEHYAAVADDVYTSLQNRWFQKEFEDWRDLYMKPHFAQSKQAVAEMKAKLNEINGGVYTQPDGTKVQVDPNSTQAIRLRENVIQEAMTKSKQLDMELFSQSADKFRNNPFVNQAVQNFIMQKTQMINSAVAPTQGLEQEKGIAEIELMRAQKQRAQQAARAERMRAEDWFALAPQQVFAKQGGNVEQMTSWLHSPIGQQYIAPKIAAQQARVQQEELIRDPSLRDPNNVNAADMLARRMQMREKEIMRKAIGQFYEEELPSVARQMKKSPEYNELFITRPPQQVKNGIIVAEKQNLEAVLADAISRGMKWDEAIKNIQEEWIPIQVDTYRERYGGDREFINKLRSTLEDYLRNPQLKKKLTDERKGIFRRFKETQETILEATQPELFRRMKEGKLKKQKKQ